MTPPAPEPALFLKGDTDPDAARPARIEAQKALPSVRALLKAGAVTAGQVEAAAVEQAQRGGRTLEILVSHGCLSDDDVAMALARSAARPLIAARDVVVVDVGLLRRIPQTYALARRLLPLSVVDGVLLLAVADPFESKVIEEVKGLLHATSVDVRVAARKALTEATLAVFGKVHGTDVAASGPRVLLCVQDEAKAQKLGDRLAQEGMQVEHVVDGHVAKPILSSRPPQAVICSHDLPGLDGRALLLHVRDQPATVELPFFVMGPRADDDLIARVLDLGADDFFSEPLRLDVVLAKLRRAIDKGKRHEVAAQPVPPPKPTTTPPPPPKKPAGPPPPSLGASGEFAFDDLPDLPPEFDTGQAAEPQAMPTGVMGTLRQMALPEIVQSLEMGRKTASVDIVPADGDKGMIGFEGGSVRYAECAGLLGEQAFFALMRHKEGYFRIHYGDAPPSVNIDAPTTFLLLEAMRLMDEEGMS
jgi:CheY-like chemotaxis protein